jgi:hypothetical protein
MNLSDAVKALADCGAELALAHHHGTFQLTDEAIDASEHELYAALEEAQMSRETFRVLKGSGGGACLAGYAETLLVIASNAK